MATPTRVASRTTLDLFLGVYMDYKFGWVGIGNDYVALLRCNLASIVVSNNGTKLVPKYMVRFGAARTRDEFANLDDAKQAGVLLARRVLSECLVDLE